MLQYIIFSLFVSFSGVVDVGLEGTESPHFLEQMIYVFLTFLIFDIICNITSAHVKQTSSIIPLLNKCNLTLRP